MKISADAAERRVCTDRFRGCFSEIGYDQTVMISARRLDGHAAQQWMIKIGSFQPRNIGCDSKKMFEHRQCAANQSSSQDSVADGKRALQSDHPPVVGDRRKKSNWPNQTKRQRQQPNGNPDSDACPEQFAAPSHLQRERDCGKSADQTGYQKRGVNRTIQDAAPETNKKRGVKAMLATQQNAECERRKGIGRD